MTCGKCGGTEFYTHGVRRVRTKCATCEKAKARRHYSKHSDKIREKRLSTGGREYHRWAAIKIRYGLSKEGWSAMLANQGGLCAICGLSSESGYSVDHDHNTGKVRGLLCHKCNISLGWFELHRVDQTWSERASSYLECSR